MRSAIYKLASLLGDYSAARRGKLPQRLLRKALYRQLGKIINAVVK